MMIKTKSVHESTIRQMQKQQNGNFGRQNKSKQIKQVKKKIQPIPPQVTSIASISAKRLHKPSRSTIEPNEQLHYNSPISVYQNENIYTNTFSFTHILQQNLKNQLSHTNLQAQIPSSVASFHLNQSKPLSIAITSRIQRKSGLNDQQMLKNTSMNKEKIMSQRDYSFPNKNSLEKSVSKSPLRTINMNKLSNTPKIRQYKKEKEEQKTFKNLLQNKENEQIRFECSQKIFKYMQEVKIQGKSLNKNDKVNCEKSKSNLLSTGIINLSQRLDHQKIPSEFIKTSKGNISNKSIVQSSNQQIRQFFEEDSSPYNENSYQEQVQKLKQKIMKVNFELSQTFTQKKALNTFQKLLQLNNFEHNHSKYNQIIHRLLKLKSFVVETVEDIISCIVKLSRSFVKDIDEYIKNYENSCKTNIDWNALDQQIRHFDHLQTIKCQNDVLIQRINRLQGKISQFDDFPKIKHKITPQKDIIEAQLRDINVKVLKTSIFNNKNSMVKPFDYQFYPKFFEIIAQNLQRLHSTIKESQIY